METSLKTDFAQIFSRCPKNLSCPKFGGLQPPSPPGPYAYGLELQLKYPASRGYIFATFSRYELAYEK